MDVEITPEPSPRGARGDPRGARWSELRVDDSRPAALLRAWREAGLRENLDDASDTV